MHMDAPEKSFYVRIYRQKWRAPRSRRTVCASLRSQNAHGHVTRIILRENLQEKCRTPRLRRTVCASLRNRNAHRHVTRAISCENFKENFRPPRLRCTRLCGPAACAVETHVDMSQGQFYARIYRKSAAPQDRDAQYVRACSIELQMGIFKEPFYARIYRKHAAPEVRRRFCARGASRKSHSMRELTGMPHPRSHSMQEFIIGKRCAPEVRSRHAHGHLRKAILCENLQEKNWGGGAPGLNFYRKNPSVWTHCLGKKACESVCLPLLDVLRSSQPPFLSRSTKYCACHEK